MSFHVCSHCCRKEAEKLAAELGVIHIHSDLEAGERMRRVLSVAQKKQRCVATTSIGVGVNLNPTHVVVLGLTYTLGFSRLSVFMLAFAGIASNFFCRCCSVSEPREDVALCWRTGNFVHVLDHRISIFFPIKLFGRAKLLAFQEDQDDKIAEVCSLLLGDFPENLFRAMVEDVLVPPAVELMSYKDCQQMALKVSSHFPS